MLQAVQQAVQQLPALLTPHRPTDVRRLIGRLIRAVVEWAAPDSRQRLCSMQCPAAQFVPVPKSERRAPLRAVKDLAPPDMAHSWGPCHQYFDPHVVSSSPLTAGATASTRGYGREGLAQALILHSIRAAAKRSPGGPATLLAAAALDLAWEGLATGFAVHA